MDSSDRKSNERGKPLVLPREKEFCIGITLNYSPKANFKIYLPHTKRKVPVCWGCMTPNQQGALMTEHLKEIYAQFFDRIYYAFELTKEGNMHCHAMGILKENPNHLDYRLQMIRKTVTQNHIVLKYTKSNLRTIIRSNYIHWVDKDKWWDYINKDLYKIPIPLRMITSSISSEEGDAE